MKKSQEDNAELNQQVQGLRDKIRSLENEVQTSQIDVSSLKQKLKESEERFENLRQESNTKSEQDSESHRGEIRRIKEEYVTVMSVYS